MSINDHIADMLIRIQNAGKVGKESTLIPYSQVKMDILELLVKEGFVSTISKRGKKLVKNIEVELSYTDTDKEARLHPRIHGARRVSRLSNRVYLASDKIKPVRNGSGLLVLSTPQGILSGNDARKAHVGGEALFMIW